MRQGLTGGVEDINDTGSEDTYDDIQSQSDDNLDDDQIVSDDEIQMMSTLDKKWDQ